MNFELPDTKEAWSAKKGITGGVECCKSAFFSGESLHRAWRKSAQENGSFPIANKYMH